MDVEDMPESDLDAGCSAEGDREGVRVPPELPLGNHAFHVRQADDQHREAAA